MRPGGPAGPRTPAGTGVNASVALILAQEAGTLSGGERQMPAMGRAPMAKPTLLMLDEPSLGLAPARRSAGDRKLSGPRRQPLDRRLERVRHDSTTDALTFTAPSATRRR